MMSEALSTPDEDPSAPQDTAPTDWDQLSSDYQNRRKELLPVNKAALFGILATAGITNVTVHFDGYADDGQIESIEAQTGDEATTDLPTNQIEILDAQWGCTEIKRQTLPVVDAIEHLTYAFLRETHGAWEDGDGAYGDFTFDVAAKTITLDYNERYESSKNYTHEF